MAVSILDGIGSGFETRVTSGNRLTVDANLTSGNNTAIINDEGQLHVVLMGKIDDGNSTITTLNADEVFTGTAFNTLDYGFIFVTIFSDVTSATDGLDVQVSSNGSTNWRSAEKYTIAGGKEKTYAFQPNKNFFRLLYTNGGTNQSVFDLQTIFKKTSSLPSSHKIADMITGQDDAQLIKSVITYQSTGTDTFKNIGVQVPLPTDGDSLYEKDINITKSDNGGFSGTILDYFNSLNSVNNDASATNPKVIKVWLKRTAFASALGLGCNDLSKNFSNIKLELFGSGEVIRNTIDNSSDDTKRNSFLFEFAPTAFNGFILSFFTADEIGLSNITVPKEVQVVSRLKAIKPDGVVTDIDATMGGNLKISLEEYDPTFNSNPLPVRDPLLGISRGLITGMSSVNKFGRNIEVDSGVTADIWDGGHTLASGGVSLIWVAPTQSRIHAIVSTSNEDSDTGGTTIQGDGARTIRIFGLTDWDTNEVNEDIIMDGTNSVNTSNSYVIIHRMLVLTKGADLGGPNVGVITATAAIDGTITAQIRATQGQTQMVIYGVPSTQKAYIGRIYANVNKSGGAAGLLDVSLLSNPEPDNELTNFLTKHTFGLQTIGTSAFTIPYYTPKVIEGPSIIKIQTSSNTNDMDVSAGFDFILVDN